LLVVVGTSLLLQGAAEPGAVTKADWTLLEDLWLKCATEKFRGLFLVAPLVHLVLILSFLLMEAICDIYGTMLSPFLRQFPRIWIKLGFKHLFGLILHLSPR
jgi:hypothetical protein